jgi:mevalonate kinase
MPAVSATAPGKMILVGEHAVVYGQPAIALPVPEILTKVTIKQRSNTSDPITFNTQTIGKEVSADSLGISHPLNQILNIFQTHNQILRIPACHIKIASSIPIASGMGSGAALAAAFFRALAKFMGISVTDQRISDLTFEAERIFHGNPSGIDNAVVSFQKPVYYLKDHPIEELHMKNRLTFILADTGIQSSTKIAVEKVREKWVAFQTKYNNLFNEIGSIVRKMKNTLINGDEIAIGNLMSKNHEILQKIGVSNSTLDLLVNEALTHKAYGAKLIGAGLGGCITALVNPEQAEVISLSLKRKGAVWILISTFHPDKA